jgi:hypothetical protein
MRITSFQTNFSKQNNINYIRIKKYPGSSCKYSGYYVVLDSKFEFCDLKDVVINNIGVLRPYCGTWIHPENVNHAALMWSEIEFNHKYFSQAENILHYFVDSNKIVLSNQNNYHSHISLINNVIEQIEIECELENQFFKQLEV